MRRQPEDKAALEGMTISPAQLMDEGTEYAGVTVAKPWGHESQAYRKGDFAVWRLALTARAETSLHAHLNKDTMLIVSEGRVIVETLGNRMPLVAGDVCVIEAGVFHKTFALTGAVVVEVETSGNRRDLVRLSDRYGRVGQSYESLPEAVGV